MAVREDLDLSFLYWPGNERLHAELSAIDGIQLIETPTRARRFQQFWNTVQRSAVKAIAQQMKSAQPDLVVVAQGDIEISSLGVHAAKAAGLPCVSYIPCPHNQAEMGSKLGALRDLCNRPLFNLPDAFITICQPMADRLVDQGCRKPIEIVYNGVEVDRFQPRPTTQARAALGLPTDRRLAGIAARVQFDQKGQDLLVRAMAEGSGKEAVDCDLVFAGDGPDLDALKSMTDQLELSERVHFLAWQSDTAALYSALDVLVLPSKFEGFPLVMIESVLCGVPVIASDIDGMQEFLPAEWRFAQGSESAVRQCLRNVLDADPTEHLAKLKKRALAEMTSETFATSFEETCRKLAMALSG